MKKKYGLDYVTPNWRLYDLESGSIVAQDENGVVFWDKVKAVTDLYEEIEGFDFG